MTGSTSSNDESPHQGGYAIDVRYFIIMLFTAMTVFFTIGFLTAPLPPSHASYNFSSVHNEGINTLANTISTSDNSETTITAADPIKRTQVKHSSEIGSKIDSDDHLNEHHVNFQEPSYEDLGQGEGVIQRTAAIEKAQSSAVEEQHLPQGQHLLVDIKNVSAKFLNSEERLAQAMVDTVKKAGLTLLSYHCHSLVPAGVSCVGVLLESHISFHTWPEEGVITLDLFTCGEKPLLPIIPVLEELFGVPRKEDREGDEGEGDDDGEKVVTLWSHELRGFRNGMAYPTKENYLHSSSDLAQDIFSPLDLYMKEKVLVTESEFHRIDIWNIVSNEDRPSYEDALKHNLTKDDPRWKSPELVSPNTMLYMNGIFQSSSDHQQEFHESLVHPAMMAHPKPVNVAVIGGGEGATIRELLKYESVESITMVELDPLIVDISRKYLPFMNDCSDFVGVAENCFDDPRVNLIIEDGATWFMDRFGAEATKQSDKFDVVILDTDTVLSNPVSPIFKKEAVNAMMNSLKDDGTFACDLEDPHNIHDPRAEFAGYDKREAFMKTLEENAGAMFVYEEAHNGEEKPNAFLTVCKSAECRDLWYADAMVIDYEIGVRMRKTKSDKPILDHFDGGTHYLFQIPPRGWEEVYCRRHPRPFECDYRGLDLTKELFEMDIEDEENSPFKINIEEDDEEEEITSVFAQVDIPKGSYIMPSDVAASFSISEYTHNKLKSNVDIMETGDVSVVQRFLDFIDEHGHKTMSHGSTLKYVEVGASSLMRKSENMEEVNVGRWMPTHPSGKQPVYSPVYDRHMVSYDVFLVATRDIKKGDEIVKADNLWTA